MILANCSTASRNLATISLSLISLGMICPRKSSYLETSAFLRKCERYTSLAAIARASGINQQLLNHYASGLKIPRPSQRKRIVDGIHKIGEEFISVV